MVGETYLKINHYSSKQKYLKNSNFDNRYVDSVKMIYCIYEGEIVEKNQLKKWNATNEKVFDMKSRFFS